MLETGITYKQLITVQPKDTAAVYGSGSLEVFATPAMVALMENTAVHCLKGHLEEGQDTVGIEINVKHIKATPVGDKVNCKAKVTEIEGRRIRFEIEAEDEKGQIGYAIHDRFIIDPVKFMAKL
ncbi:thioesterase family protein [Culturomica massiliensis]|jgi:fluoroacetyl-CoA thioesterase|uniref:thioesterase family protein n=1 Tax=Culturomica massiliensis TaxID=1841857 RepID=UPI000E55D684|nr:MULTISPECIES: thioesterase family protein [Odoribacteraceae]RHV98602.1 dihydrolipoamide acyltransferase [Odoribacter sp. OF09-27XD]